MWAAPRGLGGAAALLVACAPRLWWLRLASPPLLWRLILWGKLSRKRTTQTHPDYAQQDVCR
ncbi:hypothetical protein E2C01_053151 [Portunus trituberculatus]|uniref:Uncharacterized protein n=1 Tax=Portunus trituberculatus TaxID=210409 RepID=A0A5B7GNQ3_PORTR|nr:hypothetical protein [Portunus trituberculatus]